MLAPPERRARDRRRKRKQLAREKLDLHRVELWLTGRAIAGLLQQLVQTEQLTDKQSLDHRKVEAALAEQLEAQGLTWTR